LDLAGLQIHILAGIQIDERLGADHLARSTIDDVYAAVPVGMHQRFAETSFDVEIEQDILIDSVVIMLVVRIDLIGPDRLAGFGTPRENRASPLVVSWTHFRIPGSGIRRAVINKVEVGIEGKPAPAGAPADLPRLTRP